MPDERPVEDPAQQPGQPDERSPLYGEPEDPDPQYGEPGDDPGRPSSG